MMNIIFVPLSCCISCVDMLSLNCVLPQRLSYLTGSSSSSMMQNQLQITSNQTSQNQSSTGTGPGGSGGSSMLNHGNGGSEFNFFPSLPSFDLLRSSCLDLDCQGSSPSSNGK